MNTIKSKITMITVLMLVTLSILLSVFSNIYYQHSKKLLLTGTSFSIADFAQNINKEILRIEDNSKDLALHGELFYQIDKNRKIAELTIIKLFNNYKYSLGGGIWFEPYAINKDKKLYCIYVFRNKDNQLISDYEFESEEYNYPEKGWYKEIFPNVTPQNNVAWSLPYYEKEGSNTLMVTAGSGIYNNGKLVGISTVDWEINSIIKSVMNIKPTKNSFALFADMTHDYIIATTDPYFDNSYLLGKPLKTLPWYNTNLKNTTYIEYHGKKYIPYVKTLDNGMILIVNIPKTELFQVILRHVALLFTLSMLSGVFISFLLYLVLKRSINKPIEILTDIAKNISCGNLNTEIKLERPLEFANLANTFNKMANDIKNITQERQRIESELSIAKSIQASSLPNVFPPYKDRKEFDIFANMEPAKEVGGDFYDFYFIDEDNFMFLTADVSGKGVPAALFMMTTKTLINYLALEKNSVEEMIKAVNKRVCTNNKQGFFVTMLLCIINIRTGKIKFINCGHNPPLIKQNNGKYEYLKLDTNIIIGAFEDAEFSISELQMSKGDTIFLYTDGLTEAVNNRLEMYGEDRLLDTLNRQNEPDVSGTIRYVKEDIKKFADGQPQSDDMTALMFRYNGCDDMTETYKDIAKKENFKHFNNWIETVSEKFNLPSDILYKLQLISEELYTNIFSHGYPDNEGEVEVSIRYTKNTLHISFSDNGTPYNPLERPEPDINLPLLERAEGGLGIFIVKKSVNDIRYEYKDGKNTLYMTINL